MTIPPTPPTDLAPAPPALSGAIHPPIVTPIVPSETLDAVSRALADGDALSGAADRQMAERVASAERDAVRGLLRRIGAESARQLVDHLSGRRRPLSPRELVSVLEVAMRYGIGNLTETVTTHMPVVTLPAKDADPSEAPALPDVASNPNATE